jgi:protein SCO1/2
MSRRAALLLAFAAVMFPALARAHDAGGDQRLPVIGPAPPFTLTSQDGRSVALADLRGKVLAVTFIYTGCPDICPLVTQKMVEVQNALGAAFGAKIAFVSITLDPEHDTPAILKDYAQSWGAKPNGWVFLTGSPGAVRDVGRAAMGYFSRRRRTVRSIIRSSPRSSMPTARCACNISAGASIPMSSGTIC